MRATATIWITNLRPPATRSISGPIRGATTRNGAKPSARNSNTRERAASRSMSKNSESANATTIAASPPIMRAWVIARRRNFDAGGRCVVFTRFTDPILRDVPDGPRRLGSGPHVLVAEAPDRHDPCRFRRVGLDLAAQPFDVHVESLGVADVVVAPHPVDQRLAGQ